MPNAILLSPSFFRDCVLMEIEEGPFVPDLEEWRDSLETLMEAGLPPNMSLKDALHNVCEVIHVIVGIKGFGEGEYRARMEEEQKAVNNIMKMKSRRKK